MMATLYGLTCHCDEYYEPEGCMRLTFKSEESRQQYVSRARGYWEFWTREADRDSYEWKEAR